MLKVKEKCCTGLNNTAQYRTLVHKVNKPYTSVWIVLDKKHVRNDPSRFGLSSNRRFGLGVLGW